MIENESDLNFRVVSNTREYALAHPANNTRRVPCRLIHTELNVLPAQKQCPTSKQDGARLRRHSRAGAPFGE